jgi:hypothetical protein
VGNLHSAAPLDGGTLVGVGQTYMGGGGAGTMTLRITIHCDAKGRERAAYGDTEADSLTALARALVSAGVPDQPWTAG